MEAAQQTDVVPHGGCPKKILQTDGGAKERLEKRDEENRLGFVRERRRMMGKDFEKTRLRRRETGKTWMS